MGRPRKSLADLKLHGTYNATNHLERELEPEATGVPVKPEGLHPDAEWLWDLVMSNYGDKGPLKHLDTPTLVASCELWAVYRAAAERMKKEPLDRFTRSGMIQAYLAWERTSARLGLNPVDRRKLRVDLESKQPGVASRVRGA